MATTKRLTADRPGPVTLDVNVSAQDVNVTIDENCLVATVEITTADDEGQPADIVNRSRLDQSGDSIIVDIAPTSGVTVQGGGGGSVQTNVFSRGGRRTVVSNFSGGVVVGDNVSVISTGGGVTIVNGMVVSRGGTVIIGGSPVVVNATLPPSSSVNAHTVSGDVTVAGSAQTLRATTTSGDIEFDGNAQQVDAHTVSGDVIIGRADRIDANTTYGDIEVQAMAGIAYLRTVSGAVDLTAVDAATYASVSTVSGDVTTRGVQIQLDSRSVSSRVRSR